VKIFSHLKSDFPASLAVFFVALPLCLGVALASGAPLASGLLAGIIGGIVVGLFSSSQSSVSGPAAGMVTVVLMAIENVGSFSAFTLALVLAGGFQIVMGITRIGFIASYIPKNVIQGLLAAIGTILILKQVPHALGFDKGTEGDFAFFQEDGENTFSEIWRAFSYFSPAAIFISGLSILFLTIWSRSRLANLSFLPPSLLVVLFGILVNGLLMEHFPQWAISHEHLVKIPSFRDPADIFNFPDFSQVLNHKVWMAGLTIAIVATLETLINIEATDNLDPQKGATPPNKELVAQGIGNAISGLIGGIPITSVVVRSSVNINSGGKTKASTVLHGFWLLGGLLVLPTFLNKIPYSSLAAILIFAGYKLTKIKVFVRMYERGWSQFIPFVVTVGSIVLTDLLTGILIGSGVSIYYLLKSNLDHPFLVVEERKNFGNTKVITLPNQVSFLNKARIKSMLRHIKEKEKVIIDATQAHYVDSDVVEIFREFVSLTAPQKGIKVNILGFRALGTEKDYIAFSGVLDKESQKQLMPEQILELLVSGNERFISGNSSNKVFSYQVSATADIQNPMAAVLSCVDSRTSPDLIMDASIGDLISIRIAGNIMTPEIAGSVELATKELGVKLVVILGHSNCGAISQAIKQNGFGNFSSILGEINKSILQVQTSAEGNLFADKATVNQVSMLNIRYSAKRLKDLSPILAGQITTGEVGLVAGFYDTTTGKVTFDKLEYFGKGNDFFREEIKIA
jgi:carbonic anhydrase